ncbi:GAF domain-containing sensor histidine kinase [Methanooceanicella nereidis]|uniref:GAF domain-containing sensor histidine kinase n=1 Tax=Methanooceanicella nereidis TaxID=2052831 RepID=UPI001E2D7BEC
MPKDISSYDYKELKSMLPDILESNIMPFMAVYPDSKIMTFNRAFLEFLGYDREELLEKSIGDITPANILEHNLSMLNEVRNTGRPQKYEKEYIRKDGSTVPVEIFTHLVRDQGGRPLYFYSFITDISERKKAERLVLENLKREVILANISKLLAAARLDYGSILNVAVQRTAEYLGDSCVLSMLSKDGEMLENIAFHSNDPDLNKKLKDMFVRSPHRVDEGLSGNVLKTGVPLIINDIFQKEISDQIKPEYMSFMIASNTRRMLFVPVIYQDRPEGVLSISRSEDKGPFTQDDLKLLQNIADRAALAIENARLYNQAKQEIIERQKAEEYMRFLTRIGPIIFSSLDYEETLKKLADLAIPYLGDYCMVDIIEGGQIRRIAVAHTDKKKESSLLELSWQYPCDWNSPQATVTVLKTGKPIFIPEVGDADMSNYAINAEHVELVKKIGCRSAICVPLTAHGKILGSINLVMSDSGRNYTKKDFELAEELARRAAIALENAILYKEAQESREQAELYVDLMGHDINNMNQISMGYLEMAYELLNLDEITSELIMTPLRSLQNSSRLITNVRKIRQSKEGELKYKVIDAGEIINDIKGQFEKIPGREIIINYPDDGVFPVRANELLSDVFINLIENSIKHSRGPLTINISITSMIYGGREYYRFIVEDNGPGISDIMKTRIFNRLFRSNDNTKGMGLGLYLVKTLVNDFHGQVWAEDRVPGDHSRGSRFVILLPASK